MCLATDYNVEGMAGCHTFLMSWIYYRLSFWEPDVVALYSFPLATRWAGKKGHNDYAEQSGWVSGTTYASPLSSSISSSSKVSTIPSTLPCGDPTRLEGEVRA
ncbi:hypothetical protein Ahy_A03g010738 [Arachis hypogaea]|uniref:Aminotransferase-like plant mobile domain-containing protein n=1 Tax=Arachis hypogaea TaxID=3818 RepID=A0A445DNE5_ARAHY|nr:hypothetical protein Ahy_A03g010738 [Arachis hypogaea]